MNSYVYGIKADIDDVNIALLSSEEAFKGLGLTTQGGKKFIRSGRIFRAKFRNFG